jgi:hypothetical protein
MASTDGDYELCIENTKTAWRYLDALPNLAVHLRPENLAEAGRLYTEMAPAVARLDKAKYTLKGIDIALDKATFDAAELLKAIEERGVELVSA